MDRIGALRSRRIDHVLARRLIGYRFQRVSGALASDRVRDGLQRPLRILLEHDLANLARFRDVEDTGQHQPLHQFHQPAVARARATIR